jgi:hypothetical protein
MTNTRDLFTVLYAYKRSVGAYLPNDEGVFNKYKVVEEICHIAHTDVPELIIYGIKYFRMQQYDIVLNSQKEE